MGFVEEYCSRGRIRTGEEQDFEISFLSQVPTLFVCACVCMYWYVSIGAAVADGTRDLSECLLRVTAAYRILFDEVDRAAYNVWAGVDAVWTTDAGRVDGNDNEESESEQERNKRWRAQLKGKANLEVAGVEVAGPDAL